MKRLLPLGWMLLLAAPALTVFSAINEWDFAPFTLVAVSTWLILGARLVLPARAYYWGSLPFQWFGIVAIAAASLRRVDVLELALMIRIYNFGQMDNALGPYLIGAVALAVGLALWARQCVRVDHSVMPRRQAMGLLVAGGLALGLWVPGLLWLRAWPLNAVAVTIASSAGSRTIDNLLFPNNSLSNPRPPDASWQPFRIGAPTGPETYVFVIGESVRADGLRECGAPAPMPRLRANVLVACDVTSGSDGTHTSVPLLISREMPGVTQRVPSDATFQKAFQELGFRTYWLSMHNPTLGWPDAQEQAYVGAAGRNGQMLDGRVDAILADGQERRAIVLHSYDVHSPYCTRFSRQAPHPFPDTCDRLNDLPTPANLQDWKHAYGNAVADTMGFLDGLIDKLNRLPGRVFLIYTSDHAEALLDDHRELFGHAMREPTRWDVHVPAVFWANDAWRQANARAWRRLAANREAPLMHADLVPTLLGAASIGYQEERSDVYDLTAVLAPMHRDRLIQRNIGRTISWQQLVDDAR
ncbi:sulfatase-like hydrolase/transferase [Mitsuaria sp. GD03876]|uniref:sulfatase-like hydrolase/transferase n=1 Tax=Mitsuaria sp. GD03876 TaxID=2975399 RepID=UPI00244BA094|nr:sulfatase-like hydrolase/transferase [Mitsuaria sp. GD03876]MDH0865509.1 sulfatase-like hydrolase/transferase [Mitsuaria sp. GD03876]